MPALCISEPWVIDCKDLSYVTDTSEFPAGA
jgi:hypothetical protein